MFRYYYVSWLTRNACMSKEAAARIKKQRKGKKEDEVDEEGRDREKSGR